MKMALPGRDIKFDTPFGVEPIWFNQLKVVEAFINSGVIGQPGPLATTATTGFGYLPTMAGAPTGVPIAQAGYVATVYDTTNHKLWVYDTNSASWRGVVLT